MFQRNVGADTVLVAPSPQGLAGALERAKKAANERCRYALVTIDPAETRMYDREVATAAEGFVQWLGSAPGPGQKDHRSAVAPSGDIVELCFSPDGSLLATLTNTEVNNLRMREWPAGTVRAAWTLDRGGYHPRNWLRLIAFTPDSRTLAACERDGVVKCFDVAGGPAVSLASGPEPEIMGLAFQPAGRWLATTGAGDWIKVWPWRELLAAARRARA